MSDELAVLAGDVGTWDAQVVVRPPGAPPLPSRGVAVSRLACGGKWLITDFTNESGFEGHGVYGWDPARGKYVSTWVDSMRTFLVVAEGSFDPATRTMSFVAQAEINGHRMTWREDTRRLDDDTREFRQVFLTPEGEMETMAVTYRRRPS